MTDVVRDWCCGTPITGPHVTGCPFEPREDEPIDYGGDVLIVPSGVLFEGREPSE